MNQFRSAALVAVTVFIAACSSTPSKPSGPDLSGDWVLTTESPMGAQDAEMTIKQAGSAFSGTVGSSMGTTNHTGTLQGNAVAFNFSIDVQGSQLRIDYSGTVEADGTMKGKAVFGSFGEGTFKARRKS